ncbi:hypothetical protein BDW74DRAFT_181276 [Aspergillus multicolor]|uniref:uncharacterized protein n=1 Tax=Aspergillus multicolor TaxID=41759 RepID=UPI003CCD1DDD
MTYMYYENNHNPTLLLPIPGWGDSALYVYMLDNWDTNFRLETADQRRHRLKYYERVIYRLPSDRDKSLHQMNSTGTSSTTSTSAADREGILQPFRPSAVRKWPWPFLPVPSNAGMWVRTCYDLEFEEAYERLFFEHREMLHQQGKTYLIFEDEALLDDTDLDTILTLSPERVTNATSRKMRDPNMENDMKFVIGRIEDFELKNNKNEEGWIEELRKSSVSSEDFLNRVMCRQYRTYHWHCLVTDMWLVDQAALLGKGLRRLWLDEYGNAIQKCRPPGHLLSDSDVRLLSTELLPKLLGELNTVTARFKDKLAQNRSLEQTITALKNNPDVADHDLAKVNVLGWVYDLSGSSAALANFALSGPHVAELFSQPTTTRQSLAERIIKIPAVSRDVPSGNEAAWMRLREQLFAQEPMPVIRGLISAEKIPVPEGCKDLVLSILRIAADSFGFDFRTESLRSLLATNEDGSGAITDKLPVAYAPSTQRQEATRFLFKLQRLQALVNEPEDIGALLQCGFGSAEDIANKGDEATGLIMRRGVPLERAERIYNYSRYIVSRSDDLWTKALSLRGTGSNRDVRLASVVPLQTEPATGATEINLSTLFGVDAMGCEECASIMSPAAFFADLLQTLNANNAVVNKNVSGSSMLDELMKRRADLSQLQLSCANTNVLVPYVDLVNEVLESAVWNTENGTDQQPQIPPIDAEEGDKDEDYLLQPHNTNFPVYSDIVQKCIIPLHVFPFNQAICSIRSYLTSLGTSRLNLLSVFQSPFTITKDPDLVPLVQEALGRARSAEILNLQQEDYVAACRDSFFSQDLTGTLLGHELDTEDYYDIIGQKASSGSYWGFESDNADEHMTETLAKIKNELLPRSGLSLQDLLAVLQTRYFQERLTIAIQTDEEGLAPPASQLLESMRLHVNGGKSLEPTDCDRLQEFIRLWYKTQWPIEELDAVIYTLATLNGKTFDVNERTIEPRLLDNLAAVKELTEMLKLSATDLQPFWGDINTHGPNSLFAQLFPKGTLPDEERQSLLLGSRSGLDDDRLSAVLMALELSGDDFQAIIGVLGLPTPVDLSLPNISALYRISTLCRQLKISPQLYSSFLDLFPDGQNIFDAPQATLKIVRSYPPMQGAAQSWTLDRLLFLINRIPSATDSSCQPTLTKNLRIAAAVRASLDDQAVHDGERKLLDGNALPDLLDSLIEDREGRSTVLDFIENPGLHDLNGAEALEFVKQLSIIIGSDRAQDLCRTIAAAALRTTRRRTFLNAFLPARYREKQCQAILKSLQASFPGLSLALLKFALTQLIWIPKEMLLLADEPDSSGTISGLDVLLRLAQPRDLETGVTPRRTPFEGGISGTKPPTGEFSAYIRPPATGSYLILSDAVDKPERCTLDEAVLEFDAWTTNQNQEGPRWSARTNPLVGDRWYKLSYSGSKEDLKWQTAETAATKPMGFDRTLLIEELLVDQTGQVIVELMRASIVVDSFRLHASEVEFAAVFQELMASRGEQRLDFNNLSLTDIWDLDTWLVLREDFLNNGATLPLVALFEWLCSGQTPKTQEKQAELGRLLADKISQATAWNVDSCRDYLEAKYPKHEPSEIIELFQEVSVLDEMRDAMLFIQELSLPSLSHKDLFAAAQPAWDALVAAEFEKAAVLRLAIQKNRSRRKTTNDQNKTALKDANDAIRTGQRTALTHCLLGTQYARDNKLSAPDELYGHFLIDVQMGAELQTTRLKQAITSVQLFAQRCSLGLDSVRPEKPENLDRSMLDYVFRYRLWEADRTAFWYPENWADPTLRDDKTEQFQAVESKITQSKLDEQTISDLLKEYVHAIDEVSNLHVETYHVEWNFWDIDEHARVARIFARTRTSTPAFYHRKVTRPSKKTRQHVWTAWSKIDADIPWYDVDADGKRLAAPGSYLVPAVDNDELYLFLPEITLAQTPADLSGEDLKIDDYREKKISEARPARLWEIRMSYIKLRNGKWSSRATSPSVIIVPTDDSKAPIGISNFKFWTSQENSLTVSVEWHKGAGDGSYVALGTYLIRDQQLVLTDDGPLGYSKPVLGPDFDAGTKQSRLLEFNRFRANYIGTTIDKDLWPTFPAGEEETVYSRLFAAQTNAPINASLYWPLSLHTYYAQNDFGRRIWALTVEVSWDGGDKQYVKKMLDFPITYDKDSEVLKFYNHVSPQLVAACKEEDDLKGIFQCLSEVNHDPIGAPGNPANNPHEDVFGKWMEFDKKIHYNETATPFAIYNWELGYHLPCLIMERLMANQQFELALKIARLVFDPSISGDDIGRCWSFPPFREDCVRLNQQQSVSAWLASGRNVHAAARANPVVYMKRLVMKYIELLTAMGDQYFRQDTLESIPLATQMYIEASHVFGPQPVEVPQLGKRATKSFEQLGKLDSMGNATIDMELDFPFYVEPGSRGSVGTPQEGRASSYIKTTYFCVPGNPKVAALYNTIQDRLYKIRNGMDIEGRKRTLAIWEPPIDYGALQQARAGGAEGIAGLLSDMGSPMPRYRFSYVIRQALEMVKELKRSGQKLLLFKEKRDAEGLSSLRLQHQKTVLSLTVRTMELRKAEFEKAVEVQEDERSALRMRLDHFLALTGDEKKAPQPGQSWQDIPQAALESDSNEQIPMSLYEKLEIDLAESSRQSAYLASMSKATAQYLLGIPMITIKTQPMGMGEDTAIGGTQVAAPFLAGAEGLDGLAASAAADSAQAARIGAATRNLQERRLEANTCGRGLVRADKEISRLRGGIATCESSIQTQQLELDNATAQYDWLRAKYTGEELYALLDNSMGTLFHQTYTMAMEMAKSAQRALSFELALRSETDGNTGLSLNSNAPSGSYWEIARDGQLAGEALYLDLKRMESFYMDDQTHDFEVVKDVSLREINPLQLLALHGLGEVDFEMPEVLFDMDFPGHYCRRIASVSVSILGAAGSFNAVSCTLSLLKHRYRVSTEGNDYGKQKENFFRTDRIPITSVAISNGSQDTGLFEFHGNTNERYGPFEGAGAVSTWRIALPKELRQFDYRAITDVVVHLKYTCFGGGESLESSATTAANAWVGTNLTNASPTALKRAVVIDLKNEYPDAWDKWSSTEAGQDAVEITIARPAERFPFWARNQLTANGAGAIPPTVLLTDPVAEEPKLADEDPTGNGTVGDYSTFSFETRPGVWGDWSVSMKFQEKCEYAWLVINY